MLCNTAGAVKVLEHGLVISCRTIGIITGLFTIVFAVMWVRGRRTWKMTQEYKDYKEGSGK